MPTFGGPDQASMAERAVRRPYPRREPSAVVPLAGSACGPPARAVPSATAGILWEPGGVIPRPDHPAADLSRERIKRRPILGGLISEYERAA